MMNKKKQAIEYLKNGDIVELRSERMYMFLDREGAGIFIGRRDDDGWEGLTDYNDDLMFKDKDDDMREFDVVGIYRPCNANDYRGFFAKEVYSAELIWRRKEDDHIQIGIAEVKFAHPRTQGGVEKTYLFEIPYADRYAFRSSYKKDVHVLADTCYGNMEAIICDVSFFDSKAKLNEYMTNFPKATLPLKKVVGIISPTVWS